MMIDPSLRVLRTDIGGMPLEWIGFEEAVKLDCLGQVLYPMGTALYTVNGGINARSGHQSRIEIHSIICTAGRSRSHLKRLPNYAPPLNNVTLFRRDGNLCLYCGQRFNNESLSRDHVAPLSRGGRDIWQNVVTSCKRCNHHKGNRMPEEAWDGVGRSAFCAYSRRVHIPVWSNYSRRSNGVLARSFPAQQPTSSAHGRIRGQHHYQAKPNE
jgi:hypothetical protein